MRAEQIGFPQSSQHGKKWLSTAYFFTEKFKSVRQRVADRKAQRAQSKRAQEDIHLMPHANRAILKVVVIKPQAWIDEDAFHARARGQVNLPREVIAHHGCRFRGEIKVAHRAHILALHVADDDRRLVSRAEAKHFLARTCAREIQDIRPSFKAGAGHGQIVSLDLHKYLALPQFSHNRQQFRVLQNRVRAGRVSQCRFRANIDYLRPLRVQNRAALNG
jgi:hypothetical protein